MQEKEMKQTLEREKQTSSIPETSIRLKNWKEITKKQKIEKRAVTQDEKEKMTGIEENEAGKEQGNQEVENAAGSTHLQLIRNRIQPRPDRSEKN